MRVLTIEDDRATALSMELMMKSEGFNVYVTGLGVEGIDLAALYDYDIITLDLNLPDISGYEVLRELRGRKISTPIIVVSGADGIDFKVKAFGFGADDYLVKPFHKDELVARIHAIVRRVRGCMMESAIVLRDFVFDLGKRTASVSGERLLLTDTEARMLELLAFNYGKMVTKGMFLNHLYRGDEGETPNAKVIDVYICKLRKKLRARNGPSINTVWGRGYVLHSLGEEEVE